MAFFTMIAPLIAVTYPLDKIKDGEAQAFSLWFKEYTFNALIQPVHLIIYTMTISTVMDMLVTKHPIYALVALGFIMPAEKILRKMFGFEKAGTLSAMGQMAGGAMLYSGVQKLAGLGNKKNKRREEEQEKPVRTTEPNGVKLPENEESNNKTKTDTDTEGLTGKKSNSKSDLPNNATPIVNPQNNGKNNATILRAAPQNTRKHSVRKGLNRLGVRARNPETDPFLYSDYTDDGTDIKLYIMEWSELISENKKKLSYLSDSLNIKSADVNEVFIKEYPQLIDEKSRTRLNKRELK